MNELLEALRTLEKYGLRVVNESNEQLNKPKRKRPNRRPNGTGSVVKLSGKRRKQYGVYVTTGYDLEDGHQIQKAIGYYETREEALKALDQFNLGEDKRKKHSLRCPTFADVWQIVKEGSYPILSQSSIKHYNASFKKLEYLHNMPIDKIDLHVLQPIFDEYQGMSKAPLVNMKTLCSKVFEYGMKYDYINKDYSQYIEIKAKGTEIKRSVFTESEIRVLWARDDKISRLVLVMIYTGLRPLELVNIKVSNVFVDDMYMIGGMKTKNGTDRVIPIHDDICEVIANLQEQGYPHLCYEVNEYNAYKRMNAAFNALMKELGWEHKLYDCRHTFATLCREYGVNEFATKKMMGHACGNITDDLYTNAPHEYLKKELDKVKSHR